MSCSRCGSARILEVNGKVSDMCILNLGRSSYEGYVPEGLNIGSGSGDYLRFSVCLACGQVQGIWPVPEEVTEDLFAVDQEED